MDRWSGLVHDAGAQWQCAAKMVGNTRNTHDMKQFYEGAKGMKQLNRNTHVKKQFYEGARAGGTI